MHRQSLVEIGDIDLNSGFKRKYYLIEHLCSVFISHRISHNSTILLHVTALSSVIIDATNTQELKKSVLQMILDINHTSTQ